MKDKHDGLSPAELEEWLRRFREIHKKVGDVSDEEFMAKYEVSDEEYELGLTLPGVGKEQGGKDG